jgi:phosphoglycerate dehydrogenase-like enzyme
MADMDEILPQADFVLSVLPFTQETKNYFNYDKFSKMKKDAVFINIGRGTTVVEDDLVRALEEGLIKGAALDVFAVEPLSQESKLWGMKNVLMTPHCADLTHDLPELSWKVFGQNLNCFFEDKPILTPVNKEQGY